MPDGISVDFSDINQMATALGQVPAVAGRFIRAAVEVSARTIKDDWRESATGLAHAQHFPRSITYDVRSFQGFGSTVIEAEIGPDKDGPQGALGNLLEYGSVNNPPMGLGHGALQREEDGYERGLSQALANAERMAGIDSSIIGSAAAVMRGSYR